jgi:hypothetical protein
MSRTTSANWSRQDHAWVTEQQWLAAGGGFILGIGTRTERAGADRYRRDGRDVPRQRKCKFGGSGR